jgi:hypothetical protein
MTKKGVVVDEMCEVILRLTACAKELMEASNGPICPY